MSKVKYTYKDIDDPITQAAKYEDLSLIKRLHEEGVSCDNPNAIEFPSERNNLAMLKYLVEIVKVPVNSCAMGIAGSVGNLEVMQYLFDIAKPDCSPLSIFHCIEWNQPLAVQFFLTHYDISLEIFELCLTKAQNNQTMTELLCFYKFAKFPTFEQKDNFIRFASLFSDLLLIP